MYELWQILVYSGLGGDMYREADGDRAVFESLIRRRLAGDLRQLELTEDEIAGAIENAYDDLKEAIAWETGEKVEPPKTNAQEAAAYWVWWFKDQLHYSNDDDVRKFAIENTVNEFGVSEEGAAHFVDQVLRSRTSATAFSPEAARQHLEQLASQSGNGIAEITFDGDAWCGMNEIHAPEPTTLVDYVVGLHEVGHMMAHQETSALDPQHDFMYGFEPEDLSAEEMQVEEESFAWKWAFENSLWPVTTEVYKHARESVATYEQEAEDWHSADNQQYRTGPHSEWLRGYQPTSRFAAGSDLESSGEPCYLESQWLAWKHPDQYEYQAGMYAHPEWGDQAHAWVRKPDGTIVDTTHGQFDPNMPLATVKTDDPMYARYKSWNEHPDMQPDFDNYPEEFMNDPADPLHWLLRGRPGHPHAGPTPERYFGVTSAVDNSDDLPTYLTQQQQMGAPAFVALTNPHHLEFRGGKTPIPGAQPYDVSKEGVPLYKVMDLGWNPETNSRENADVNALAGAPEWRGQYGEVPANKRGEVRDFDHDLKWAYVHFPLHYPEGQDVRLHPHAHAGWVPYSDLRVVHPPRTPFRKRR